MNKKEGKYIIKKEIKENLLELFAKVTLHTAVKEANSAFVFFSIFYEIVALLLIRCEISVLLEIMILAVSDIVIMKLAPIDNESKRMSLDEKYYYARRSRKKDAIFTVLSLGMLPLEEKRFFISMVTGK